MPLRMPRALAEAARRLRQAGVDNAAAEAAWLLTHVLQVSVGRLRLLTARELTAAEAGAFAALVDRRVRREPLQYILGTQEFLGLSFQVNTAVLIPRPETEVLVRIMAERLPADGVVADIGTGSGCIAVGLCHLLPRLRVIATDIAADALAVAQANAGRIGCAGRTTFRLGDLYVPLRGEPPLDGVVANPPYVAREELATLMPEVRDWEPHLALCPGDDPYHLIRGLVDGAPAVLKAGGWLGLEVGFGQAETVAGLLRARGFVPTIHPDQFGVARCVIGQYRWAG